MLPGKVVGVVVLAAAAAVGRANANHLDLQFTVHGGITVGQLFQAQRGSADLDGTALQHQLVSRHGFQTVAVHELGRVLGRLTRRTKDKTTTTTKTHEKEGHSEHERTPDDTEGAENCMSYIGDESQFEPAALQPGSS